MQVSVVSPESALEKPVLAATVPVDESNSPLCSFGTSLRSTPAGQGKSNPDPAKEDAANLTPVSHVKSKVKKEKVKKVATKENPAASVESSEQAGHGSATWSVGFRHSSPTGRGRGQSIHVLGPSVPTRIGLRRRPQNGRSGDPFYITLSTPMSIHHQQSLGRSDRTLEGVPDVDIYKWGSLHFNRIEHQIFSHFSSLVNVKFYVILFPFPRGSLKCMLY